MRVFTVHVRATEGGGRGVVCCDSISVCKDRLAVLRALGNVITDPLLRMFADPEKSPEFEGFWREAVMDRIGAYEGAENAMVSNRLGNTAYMVAVEQKEVLE